MVKIPNRWKFLLLYFGILFFSSLSGSIRVNWIWILPLASNLDAFFFCLLGHLPSTLYAEGYLKKIPEKITSAYLGVSGTLKLVLIIYLFCESLVAILLSKADPGEGTAFTRATIRCKITKSYLSRSILNDTEDGSMVLCVCTHRSL